MADRVSALSGTLSVHSPPGGGTRVTATLPLPAPWHRPGTFPED